MTAKTSTLVAKRAYAEIEALKADLTTYVAMSADHAGEIMRLRADPNHLDLAGVPTTHEFIDLSRLLRAAPYIGGEADIIGTGPTPAAALADAVGRIG
jgi:hypothetical protein